MRRRTRTAGCVLAVGLMFPAAGAADPGHPVESPPPTTAAGLLRVKLLAPRIADTTGGAAANGAFTAPQAEPTVNGVRTDEKCVEGEPPNTNIGKGLICKPAAGTLVNLPNGKILYWDALEGTENNQFSIVTEGGATFTNDASRLLDLGRNDRSFSWSDVKPFDGGANPNGNPGEPLIPGGQTTETYNDGALFGSHQSFLPDGKLLIQGGTDYSLDPGVDGIPFGAVELTGLVATRIFDPKTNSFEQTTDTASRRWYPTLLEMGDGTYLDFSGVGKLLKPVYPERPQDSGTNVKQVERFDPATKTWTTLPASANYDLPLYPRMSLLPDGKAFFNANGQSFNPFGQSVGELNWENLAVFDPKTNEWTQKGLANTSTPLAPGFRGSTSSTLLPLEPDADGAYTKAHYLTAGGVFGPPSPGSYLPTDQSSITTVDTANDDEITQHATGALNTPRWFGQNILLPTGQVIVFSGASADEVVGPGTEFPRQQAEMFDPETEKWTPIATANNPRTYHNSAVLLPSGKILVGGHATISTLYLNNTTLPGGFAPHDGRDPSFEVFSPPYLFWGARPKITQRATAGQMGLGGTMKVRVKGRAKQITSVSLVRNSAITHIVDADQRTVMLKVLKRRGHTVTVATPPDGNVAPPGPYMLFANATTDRGDVPSKAKGLFVTTNAAKAKRAARKADRAARR